MNEETKKLTIKELEERTDRGGQVKKPFASVLSDLRAGFMRDFTDEESCHYAGINKSTYYVWRKESDEFCEVIDIAKTWLFRKAKQNLVDAVESGDPDNSKWLLSRRQKDIYSERQEQTGKGGGKIQQEVTISNYKRQEIENLPEEEKIKIINKQITDENT